MVDPFEQLKRVKMLVPVVLLIHCSLIDVTTGRAASKVDLTYNFSNVTPTMPFFTVFQSNNRQTLPYYNTTFQTADYSGSEHSGTHMDAPYHFNINGLTMEEVPMDLFEGPGVVINISSKADLLTNPDAQITIQDILNWEQKYHRIAAGSVVIMYSGWGKYVQNKTLFSGVQANDSSKLHFPGFGAEACQFLLNERQIRTFAVDTLSVDYGASTTVSCHVAICGQNGVIIENLANVDQLPPSGSYIRAFPMKIEGGSAAPVRVIATFTKKLN